MRNFFRDHFGVFIGGIILAGLLFSYTAMEKASYKGPVAINLINEAQIKLKERVELLYQECERAYPNEKQKSQCFIQEYTSRYGYNRDFERFNVNEVFHNLQRGELFRGIFIGFLVTSILFFIL